MANGDSVSIKEYVDRRFADLERHLVERFSLSDTAVSKAEHTMDARLNSMNEFRDALRDQANRMATRIEVDQLRDQIGELRRAKANLDGRIIAITGTISVGLTIALWWLGRFIK